MLTKMTNARAHYDNDNIHGRNINPSPARTRQSITSFSTPGITATVASAASHKPTGRSHDDDDDDDRKDGIFFTFLSSLCSRTTNIMNRSHKSQSKVHPTMTTCSTKIPSLPDVCTKHPEYVNHISTFTSLDRSKSMFSYSIMSQSQIQTSSKADDIIDGIADMMGCEFGGDHIVEEEDDDNDDDDSAMIEDIKAPIWEVSLNPDGIGDFSFESDLTEDSYDDDDILLSHPVANAAPSYQRSKGVFEIMIDTFGGDSGLCARSQSID